MTNEPPNLSPPEQEEMLQCYVRSHSPVKLFPVLESKENLFYFIGQTCLLVAAKVNEQQPKDLAKGRPDAAFLRGLSWLDKLIWNELWLYPRDLLFQRTARLCGVILQTAKLPRKPKDVHDPIRVALEYDLLLKKFSSLFQRRPRRINFRRLPQYHESTFGRERGVFLSLLVGIMDEKRQGNWADKRTSLAGKQLDIPWWLKTRTFELNEDDLLESTPREAALKVLAYFLEIGKDMVWELVKEGRDLLSSEAIEALEKAWEQRRHDPAACHFLQCPHVASKALGQQPLSG